VTTDAQNSNAPAGTGAKPDNTAEQLREQYIDLPEAMRNASRWLVWRYEPNPDGSKPRKVPYYPNGARRHGAQGTESDRARMGTFEDAVRALAGGNFTGLGFALGPDGTGNHWQGIDLDDLPARPHLKLIADDLPGYTETSPSGKGMHAIGYGQAFGNFASNGTGVEAYSLSQFFTVTGENAGLGEPVDLAAFVAARVVPVHSQGKASGGDSTATEFATPQQIAELRSALASMRADDRDAWVANGQRLKKLGEVGRALWLEWSQTSDKWNPPDARLWDTFDGDRTGFAAVFKAAAEGHWTNPMSNAASMPKTKAANDPAPPRVSNAAELLKRQFAPVQWAVRGILPEGISILSGDPKIGKSWLLYQACVAVSSGRALWAGREPEEQGEALMLALEDNDRRLQRRLEVLLPRFAKINGSRFIYPEMDRLHYATEWPRAEAGVAQLAKWLRAHPNTRLVVIDTVSAFRDPEPGRKSAYATDYAVGEMLKPLAKEFSCAVVLVMHNRKQHSEDALQLVSGTQGMTGGVDNVLVLRRERGRMDAGLYVDGRDIEEPQEIAMRFDEGYWCSDGQTVHEAKMTSERRKVLDVVRELGAEARIRRIAAELSPKKYSSVSSLLSKMTKAGDLVLEGGLYTLPGAVGEAGEREAA